MSRNIDYFKKDTNHLENLGESQYNAIFNVGVLHHTFRLTHALWKLSRALKSGGFMFNFDYVGPSRNQYSDNHLTILKEMNKQLPKRFQSEHRLRPDKKDFDEGDPSEAIHSDLVRSIFERFFDIIYQRDLNGGMTYQILWNNIKEFKKNDREAIETLEFLLQKDAEYTESKKVPVLFWYGVGMPRPKEHIRNYETLST